MITLKTCRLSAFQSAFYTPTHFCSILSLVHIYTHTHKEYRASLNGKSWWSGSFVCISHFMPQLFNKEGINGEPHFFISVDYGTASAIKCQDQSVKTSIHLVLYLLLLPPFCIFRLTTPKSFLYCFDVCLCFFCKEIKMFHSILTYL